jgi:hypothetical protein
MCVKGMNEGGYKVFSETQKVRQTSGDKTNYCVFTDRAESNFLFICKIPWILKRYSKFF